MIQYRCPTCRRTITVERRGDAPYRPFCTERCQLIDLGRWLAGEYTVSEPVEIDHANEPAAPEQQGG